MVSVVLKKNQVWGVEGGKKRETVSEFNTRVPLLHVKAFQQALRETAKQW